MPLIDTNHHRAALLVLLLGVALVIALTPYATGLIGIPVLYAVFAPVHEWLSMRMRPKLAATVVVLLALFLIVVPGVSFAGLIVNQAQGIAGGVIQSPLLGRLKELRLGGIDLGPRLADLGARVVGWIGSSAFGLIGTATRLALNLTISLFGLFYLLLRPHEPWQAGGGGPAACAVGRRRGRERGLRDPPPGLSALGEHSPPRHAHRGTGGRTVLRDPGTADRTAGAELLFRAREDVQGRVSQLA